ncbi:MAG: hypothetical protein KY445_06160 [Armatimonadetes bacterium]|nr:hypothetical protein [Armatimonadota bacterium]
MKALLSRPSAPLFLLTALCLTFWSRVLLTDQVLLPGAMLRGFAPFGNDPNAPWTILQWDALAQYFPWRHYAAQSLRGGEIPLWNPFQFSGTPFLANAQSAVLYPLNLPFWIFDTARAFGIAAFAHSILASFATYFLARRWNLSRAAAVVAATIYTFCGYLSAWALLPTLFATASWLPLCLLLFEKASDEKSGAASFFLALALGSALLAGHAQIFFYILLALALRQPFLERKWRGLAILCGATLLALALGAAQLLPTLELARLGHRAGGPPTLADWEFWKPRALQGADWPSLLVPNWPMSWGSLNENFGYLGVGALGLGILGVFFGIEERKKARKEEFEGDLPKKSSFLAFFLSSMPKNYAFTLAIFGLLYALATPVSQFFFFNAPGVSQMGGTGRALLLWSLGVALLAGFGLDLGRSKIKSALFPIAALLFVGAELFFNAFSTQPTAPRAWIYPPTQLTTFLAQNSAPDARVLFVTPKNAWLPAEALARGGRNHPPGVLPPNGAMVYGIHDVNGYDSLSPRVYRAWVGGENGGPSPQLNGNMVLLESPSPALLDSLAVRYVVTPQGLAPETAPGRKILSVNGADVWQREIGGALRASGASFTPGWKAGKYQPETFRLGGFVSLCALGFVAAALVFKRKTWHNTKERQ